MENVCAVSKSERGLVRKDNQDHVLCLKKQAVFVVADGMGGGAEGERASRIVCETLERGLSAAAYLPRLDEIGRAIDGANARIVAYAKEKGYRQMGSTIALLAFDTETFARAAVGYIGDSRVYRLRAGAAELLTRDHSVGAELEAKVGSAAGHKFALRSNPLAHVLTRVIGTEKKVSLEWRKIDVRPGDRFVICSDGVHDVVGSESLGRLVSACSLERAASSLDAEVVRCGAPDNYSYVIVDVGGLK